MKAPYPWFGGKSSVSDVVWARFGHDVPNFVDPFMGSCSILLDRDMPDSCIETVNDADGFIANFWRAVKADPDAVAHYADWPVNENDLHARHIWLVNRRDSMTARLEGGPDYFDAKIAGWWVWGMACWIGGGFCSGKGPWQSVEIDGVRQLVHLGDGGRGVKRQLVHLGDGERGVNRQLVHLGDGGQGVQRQLVHLGNGGKAGDGECGLVAWMRALSKRFSRVRVCCGDWSRVCTPTPTIKHGTTAVFFDPPYGGEAGRDSDLYATESLTIAADVRRWCVSHGNDKRFRIALCGYDVEHVELEAIGWAVFEWKAKGGYGNQADGAGNVNRHRERIWFSPHCLKSDRSLWDELP